MLAISGAQSNSPAYPHHAHKPHLLVSSIRPTPLLAIHQVSAKGEILETIPHGTGYPKYPTYSPDGEWLIFSSEKNGKISLYMRPANDPKAEPRKLTNGETFEGQAVLSKSGFIYFTSSLNGTLDIFRARFTPAEGIRMEEAVNLTKGQGSNFSPALSPDEKWLSFTSNRHSKDRYQGANPKPNYKAGAVYMMSAEGDGSDARQLSSGFNSSKEPQWQGGATWSKDGSAVTFYAGQEKQIQLMRYYMASQTVTQVGPAKGKSLFPTTHPLTGELVFAHQKAPEKRWKILRMDKGGRMTKLFSLKGQSCWAPRFRSDGVLAVNATTEKTVGHIVESVEKPHYHFDTVTGYFPIREGEMIYAVEEMERVTRTASSGQREILFKPDMPVFGLSKSPACNWLVTTVGKPFADTPGKDYKPANIYKLFLDKTPPINLTEELKGRNVFPTVPSEGDRIIFVHQNEGESDKQLYSMDSSGKNIRPLTNGKGIHTMPNVSHDGRKVVFSHTLDKVSYQLKVLHLHEDGSPEKIEDVTEEGKADTHPTFAPDGKKVAFSSERGGFNEEIPYTRMFFCPQPYGDVYAQDLEKKTVERVSDTTHETSTPTWQ